MLRDNTHTAAKILLLDEDRILLESLGQFLRREGFDVDYCTDARHAVSMLADGGHEVLLADINLADHPEQLLRDVRREAEGTAVVVVTGYGSIEQAVSATKLGAFDYLIKPIVDDEIRLVLAKALQHQRLMSENSTLRRKLDERYGFEQLFGQDLKMHRLLQTAAAAAESRSTVLVVGESGVGKSLLAKAMHQRSPRRDGPFVEVSCGALSEALLESELFGHVKGAFTGAVGDRPGRFESAEGGTIFLDEINSAPLSMQVKLLRVLQERLYEPVGSSTSRKADVRVIVASNQELGECVKAGTFREDLLYRVNVVTLRVPPLRDRPDDVPLLARRFLLRMSEEAGRKIVGFDDDAMAALRSHNWPGNVRELENAVEHAVVLSRKPTIGVADLPETVIGHGTAHHTADWLPAEPMPLEQALEMPEKRIIERALTRNAGSRQMTAAELGINRTTLYKKMRRYGLDRP